MSGRRRPLRALLVAGIVVLALVAAFFVGDQIARGIVQDRVREAIQTELGLPAEQRIEVAADGVIIPQLIAGRLDDLRVAVDDLAFDGLSGDVVAFVHGLPIRGEDVRGLGGTARVAMDEDDVAALLARSDGPWTALGDVRVSLPGPEAVFASQLSVLGRAIPLEFRAVPGVADGDIVATPSAIRVGDLELTAETIDRAPIDLSALTRPLTICRADALPRGVEATDVEVAGGRLTIRLAFADGFVDHLRDAPSGGCV